MSLEPHVIQHTVEADDLRIREGSLADRAIIRHIAELAWPVAFGHIVSVEFLQHELEREYSDAALHTQMQELEHGFLLATTPQGESIGFVSYSVRPALPNEPGPVATVHKLYLLPNLKGKGYGAVLLNAAEERVRTAGAALLELSVNRQNPAIRFYQRQGFVIACERDIEVGPGFVREDYLMVKPLTDTERLN